MATNSFTSGWDFQYGAVPASVEEVRGISGLGELSELVEATHFASGGSREYIGGLTDGQEFTVECNAVLTASSVQETIRGDVGTTEAIEIDVTDGTNTTTITFNAVVLGYEFGPSIDDVNTLTFTFKISGTVTYA